MIEQQLGFSLESFLRGIVGISTVLGVAYPVSYTHLTLPTIA